MSIETFKSHDIIFNAIGGMKMTIGERLKAVRNDHDLNQEHKHYFRSHTLHTFHKVFHSPSETEPNYKSLHILPSS